MKPITREFTAGIKQLLHNFPCVVVLGARQTGKTTLLRQVLPDAPIFDLERTGDYERITADPLFFLNSNPLPLLIDEAQLCPELFSAIRVKIDEDRGRNGQFLLSGSSSPELLKNVSESLAGRVAIVELSGFSWSEAARTKPSRIYQLLNTQDCDFQKLQPVHTLDKLYELCFYGGYPDPYLARKKVGYTDLWCENYLSTYLHRDIRRLFPGLKAETYKRFIKMMSFSSGETINASEFARSLDVSQPTAKNYFDIAQGTYFWRIIPSYQKSRKKRLVKMPKGHLRDTGLITHLLNIPRIQDLKNHPKFGAIWETFIIEQLIKNLQSNLIRFDYYYYRTADQSEVDLVLEGKFGLIPIEIKTGLYRGKEQIKGLINFVAEYDCKLGILINNESEIVKLTENIYQIPAVFW